ncbi:dTDP-4-dehydrorhamnose 3,5-epimerase [soil metagenome]
MEIRRLAIPDVVEIVPARQGDARGFFSEVYSERALAEAGVAMVCVQENHSYSAAAGVVRGLHFQAPPAAQDKLIRCVRGSIFDVAVDIRQGSPTYGKWVSITLSAGAWNQIFVPRGFAHGFAVLEAGSEVIYMVSTPYSQSHERAIRFDDAALAIPWPLGCRTPILSDKDRAAPLMKDTDSGFRWDGGRR